MSEHADELAHLRHALIGVERGRQGAGQTIPEDLALCMSCGWMCVSDYAEHLAAEGFRAGYHHAQAEEEADRPLPVPGYVTTPPGESDNEHEEQP